MRIFGSKINHCETTSNVPYIMLGPGQGGWRVRLIFVCRVRGRMVSETFDLEENATFKGKTFPIGWGGEGSVVTIRTWYVRKCCTLTVATAQITSGMKINHQFLFSGSWSSSNDCTCRSYCHSFLPGTLHYLLCGIFFQNKEMLFQA